MGSAEPANRFASNHQPKRNGRQIRPQTPCDLSQTNRQRLTQKSESEGEIKSIHGGIKRFENPHIYPVGLEERLHNKKMDLILKLRKYETT